MSDPVTLAVEKDILQGEVNALRSDIGKLKADRATHHGYLVAMQRAFHAAAKAADSAEADMAQCIARESP